ncbi:MAG: TolC family protein [Limisphaerales bacterium]
MRLAISDWRLAIYAAGAFVLSLCLASAQPAHEPVVRSPGFSRSAPANPDRTSAAVDSPSPASSGERAGVRGLLTALEQDRANPPTQPRAVSPPPDITKNSNEKIFPVDLPTVLRLAHAQNLDIQIARQKLAEARADHEGAVYRFFPWISPGITYGRHEDQIQDVLGTITNADKQFYAPGATVMAQVQFGDAIYASLATRQLERAAHQAVAAQQEDSALAAAQGYFELAKAQAETGVAREALDISRDYEDQLHRAVGLGIAFKGDEYRVRVQTDRYQLALRQSRERERVAAARLAEVLHLDATVELTARDTGPVPLTLIQTNAPLDTLVAQALTSRPELKQNQAVVAAARKARTGAVYGPLIPSLDVQAFAGGLGGGKNNDSGHFGESGDALVFLGWRVGPGGLFDASRRHATEARLESARLGGEKLKDQIVREVVESHTRALSLADQIATTQEALANAAETLRLTKERKAFAVGDVLENIQSQQELARARNDFVDVVAEYNKTQYALSRAVGSLATPAASASESGK